ncbi:aminoglycoside 6-adenylyltransferase [Lysinibacillus sp. NPDC056232]
MNDSGTNPNAPRDIFKNYYIVYVVTEISSFRIHHC